MQDRTGGDLNKFFGIVKEYLEALNKRPEFQMAMTSYNPNYPQYMVNINVAKCKQAGISPTTVLSTLQGYYGGLYASNFNSYGKLYRVMIQGTPEVPCDDSRYSRVTHVTRVAQQHLRAHP